MVMSHQYDVNSQFIQYRRELFTSLKNVAVIRMTCCGVYGMMENNRLPCHIRIGCYSLFHEFLMLCRRHIIGVDIHEECVIIYEPVVCSGSGCTVFIAFIRKIEMLIICCTSAVVVTDGRYACE